MGSYFFYCINRLSVGCIASTEEYYKTEFDKKLYGLGVFCFFRLMIQIYVYSRSLRTGKPFETMIHILFLCIWTYFSSFFLLNYLLY